MKRVGILYHPQLGLARTLAQELSRTLGSLQAPHWSCSVREEEEALGRLPGTDLLLTLGGDGTILRAARMAVVEGTPILGVRLGRVGFLSEVEPEEVGDRVHQFLDGQGWVEERMMLQVTAPGSQGDYHALNDVVVARGTLPRTISIRASIDGEFFASYVADGLVVSTPTGSTGYSLAAGGPVVHPQSQSIVMAPVCPHLSPGYPLVLPDHVALELQVLTELPAALTVDGQIDIPLNNEDRVAVRRSPRAARFLRFRPPSQFYGTLARRLKCRE